MTYFDAGGKIFCRLVKTIKETLQRQKTLKPTKPYLVRGMAKSAKIGNKMYGGEKNNTDKDKDKDVGRDCVI